MESGTHHLEIMLSKRKFVVIHMLSGGLHRAAWQISIPTAHLQPLGGVFGIGCRKGSNCCL